MINGGEVPPMIVKLKIVHGRLQNATGQSAGLEVRLRRAPLVIGSDPDCSLCCRSSSVSPHHCEVRLEPGGPVVRDLFSQSGTFVNDQRVEHEQPLQVGDRLRVGRLEFAVVIETEPAGAGAEPPAASGLRPDAVADYISDLLVEADEEERARRREDPEARQFHLEPGREAAADRQAEPGPKKPARPVRKKPGKLPPPPPLTADSTVEAAEEVLKKIFAKDKKRPKG
jgi:pSer/pThr/pTyr-binding forkhead associated (FHA) protein